MLGFGFGFWFGFNLSPWTDERLSKCSKRENSLTAKWKNSMHPAENANWLPGLGLIHISEPPASQPASQLASEQQAADSVSDLDCGFQTWYSTAMAAGQNENLAAAHSCNLTLQSQRFRPRRTKQVPFKCGLPRSMCRQHEFQQWCGLETEMTQLDILKITFTTPLLPDNHHRHGPLRLVRPTRGHVPPGHRVHPRLWICAWPAPRAGAAKWCK